MKLLTSIILLLFSISLSGQLSVQWSKTLGGSSFESASGILETDQNKLLILGSSGSTDLNLSNNIGSSDIVLIQTDNTGEIEWFKNYGGTKDDKAADIIKSSNGGYLIVGSTLSMDNQVSNAIGSSDVWILKVNNVGDLEWELTVGDTLWDDSRKVIQNNEGDYLILSRSHKEETADDFLLTKVDELGNLIWNKEYGGSQNEWPVTILETNDGYILVGSSESNDMMVTSNNGEIDFWILKIDKSGNKLWDKSYGGLGSEVAASSIITNDGNILVIGRAYSLNPGENNGDYRLIKLDTDGNLLWDKTYGGSEIDNPSQISELDNGDLLIVGFSSSSDGDLITNNGNNDFWILQLSNDGDIINSLSIGGTNSDRLTNVTISNERILVAGHSSSSGLDISSNNGSSDIWYGELGITTSTIELEQAEKAILFPNPAFQSITVKLPYDEYLKSITIFAIDGQVVKTGSSNNINISELTPGNYIFHVASNKGNYQHKIVVKNGM